MTTYTEKDLLKLAKRINNPKRNYLLVDPLQAKHMPVSPSAALNMMKALGRKVAELYPETRLVIGFAETATAVGAVTAGCISDDCVYIHTTREEMSEVSGWIEFLEEHSHAAEQKLASEKLKELFASTETIVLVDDELSTGKTTVNIVENLMEVYPELEDKKIVAASIINRVSDENTAVMKASGIENVSLLKLENLDYTKAVENIEAVGAERVNAPESDVKPCAAYPVPDARLGVKMGDYNEKLAEISEDFINSNRLNIYGKVLVMGTEEAMSPSLVLAEHIEASGIAEEVKCHSTTRSPIGISQGEDYPVKSGHIVHSFYSDDRTTFIYNLEKYDTAIIFTDAKSPKQGAVNDLTELIRRNGCDNILLIKGDNDVQHI